MSYSEKIHCVLCKRELFHLDIHEMDGLIYCLGCNHYFPRASKVRRQREEIVIPNGTDVLRLRLERDELTVKLVWRKNYSFSELMDNFINVNWFVYMMNKTIVEANPRFLRIQHKPFEADMPLVYFATSSIKQLHVDKSRIKTEYDYYWADSLIVELHSGHVTPILWNLDKTSLLYLEQEIERVMKIEDVR